jgi:hypothetical protein
MRQSGVAVGGDDNGIHFERARNLRNFVEGTTETHERFSISLGSILAV